jgi:hypothetical protein
MRERVRFEKRATMSYFLKIALSASKESPLLPVTSHTSLPEVVSYIPLLKYHY